MALAPLAGCTSPQPVVQNGRYQGIQQVHDPGKDTQLFGFLWGGIPGALISAAGRHQSEQQAAQAYDNAFQTIQSQIDQGTNRQSMQSPRERFLSLFENKQSTAFICNAVEDSNNNGIVEPNEFIGDFDGNFASSDDITLGYIHWGQSGQNINLQLRYPGGKVSNQNFTIIDPYGLERISIPQSGRELGNYTFVLSIDGKYAGHAQFRVEPGSPGVKYSQLKTFGGKDE